MDYIYNLNFSRKKFITGGSGGGVAKTIITCTTKTKETNFNEHITHF